MTTSVGAQGSAIPFIPPVCSIGTSEQLAKLYCALAKAQGEFEPITKNRTGQVEYHDGNGFLQTKEMRYADLEEITAKTRPALSKHGLATIQPISHAKHGGGLAIFTQLIHEDGGMLISEIPLGVDIARFKDAGSAITYLRRYAKGALLDVSAEEDLDNRPGQAQQEQQAQAVEDHPEQRAGEVRVVDEGPQDGLPLLSHTEFSMKLPGLVKTMERGRKPHEIIAMLKTRNTLTEEQMQTIVKNAPNGDIPQ